MTIACNIWIKLIILRSELMLQLSEFVWTLSLRYRIKSNFILKRLKNLDFDRNNLFTHFCLFKLLILREKRFAVFFGPLEYQKITNFQKIFIRESCTKKVQFCSRRRKSHFFYSPCISSNNLCLYVLSQLVNPLNDLPQML